MAISKVTTLTAPARKLAVLMNAEAEKRGEDQHYFAVSDDTIIEINTLTSIAYIFTKGLTNEMYANIESQVNGTKRNWSRTDFVFALAALNCPINKKAAKGYSKAVLNDIN